MQTFDGIPNRLLPFIVLLLTAWSLSACDDSTIVGGNLSPDDALVNADTVVISNISMVSSPAFSGNRPFFTSGSVNDPVFGDIKATALLRPSITKASGDSIGENDIAYFTLNAAHIFGDTLESATFHVVEVDRHWRSTSWRYDSIPDLSDRIVTTFQVAGADSISEPMNADWLSRYREIFLTESAAVRDSLYRADMPGLAIVPAEDHGKMFSAEGARTRIVFHSATDTLTKGMNAWAVSLETESPDDEQFGTSKLVNNTFGSMIKLDFEISEEMLGTNSFSQVQLVLYEDTVRMDSGLPANYQRPRSATTRLYYLEPDQINYAITVDPRFQSNRNDDDGSYRFNLTNLAYDRLHASSSDSRRLYVLHSINDGRYLPKLFGSPDDPARQPKILITSISQEQ